MRAGVKVYSMKYIYVVSGGYDNEGETILGIYNNAVDANKFAEQMEMEKRNGKVFAHDYISMSKHFLWNRTNL